MIGIIAAILSFACFIGGVIAAFINEKKHGRHRFPIEAMWFFLTGAFISGIILAMVAL